MKAFVIHTRQVPGCACKAEQSPLFFVEVEGEKVSPMEDPSVLHLPQGEFRFRITKPTFFHETVEVKKADGSREKMTVPTVYHSHAVFMTEEEAMAAARKLVLHEFEFALRKKKIASYTEEEVQARLAEMQRVRL